MSQKVWSKEEISFIKKNVDLSTGELRKALNKKFKTDRSSNSVYYAKKKYLSEVNDKDFRNDEDLEINLNEDSTKCESSESLELKELVNSVKEKFDDASSKLKKGSKKLKKILEDKKIHTQLNEAKDQLSKDFGSILDNLFKAAEEIKVKSEKFGEKIETKVKDLNEKLDNFVKEAKEKAQVKVEDEKEVIIEDEAFEIVEITLEEKLKPYRKLIKKFVKEGSKTKDILSYLKYNTSLDISKDELKEYIKTTIK